MSRYEPDPSIEGKRIGDLAQKAGKAPEEYVLDLLEQRRRQPGVVQHAGGRHRLIMRQPWTMTCTDGDLVPMNEGMPHPRAYGAFARKLELYVRERGVVDLPFAIRSMTSSPRRPTASRTAASCAPAPSRTC